MCLYGFITGGEYPIILEFAPEFSGTVFGFSNTFASSTGFLAPIIVGFILDSDSGQVIFINSAMRYVIFASRGSQKKLTQHFSIIYNISIIRGNN
jgi:MFS family permease